MKKRKVIHFTEIGSTQNFAGNIASQSAAGTIVIAEKQTEGRGRFERTWHSQKGGLFFSIILKPKIEPQKVSILTYKMALAIQNTIREILTDKKFDVLLKWPNDVVIKIKNQSRQGGTKIKKVEYKKIAGILTESSINKNKIDWVVVGVGLNINNKTPAVLKDTAISLKEIIKKNVLISKLFGKIIKNFEKYYVTFSDTDTLKNYRKNSVIFSDTPGRIAIDYSGFRYTGCASKIMDNGGLEIILSSGRKKIFYSGDIILN